MKRDYLFLIFVVMMLSSCFDERAYEKDDLDKLIEKVQLALFTNAQEYQIPTLRSGSADENGINATPWIAVFHGTGDNAVFTELEQAFLIGSKSYVSLTKTNDPCRLLIIANAPATFFDGVSEKAFNQANLLAYLTANPVISDALNGLYTARLTQPLQTTVPYTATVAPFPLIPMSGIYDVPKIDANTTIGTPTGKVFLSRIVAKVTVESTAADFTLLAATVVAASSIGRFNQLGTTLPDNTGNTTDYLTSATGDGVTGIAAATNNTTAANPIYLYASRASQKTSVIIRGNYLGSIYYYRLAFADKLSLIDILRNKQYLFTITSVTLPGYSSMAEAMINPASNIRYTITVDDQISTEMDDNGEYYVGVTNSDFTIYSSEAISNALAFIVTTNATQSFGTNKISYTPTAGPGLSISPSVLSLAATAGSIASTLVVISASGTTVASAGYITIQLGDIIRTVDISRLNTFNSVVGTQIFSNYVSGVVISQGSGGDGWLSLSANPAITGSDNITLSSPGPIYLTLSNNTSGTLRTRGEVMLSRGNSQGRSKIIINQK